MMIINPRFRCNICDKKLKCSHMGKRDVTMHGESKSHLNQAKSLKSQTRLSFSSQAQGDMQRMEAELRMAVLTASSNVPLAIHNQLSPMIRKAFQDSKISAKYHSASTKATCMVNEAVAPMLIENLLESMKTHPYSISVDGSNDSGLEKMNPVTITRP